MSLPRLHKEGTSLILRISVRSSTRQRQLSWPRHAMTAFEAQCTAGSGNSETKFATRADLHVELGRGRVWGVCHERTV
jgi:hypothetical protein